jgi:hypothetical protein
VKLNVDGQEFTQQLTVKKDPNSGGTEADIRNQLKLTLEIQDDINTIVGMIDQLEWIRRQIYDLSKTLEGDAGAVSVVAAAKSLDEKLAAVEAELFPVHNLTGAIYDSFRGPHMLYGRMCALAHRIRTSDFPPTTQAVELHEVLKGRMQTYQSQFDALMQKDVPDFNRMLGEQNLKVISTGLDED